MNEMEKALKLMQQVTPRLRRIMQSVPPSGSLQASFYTQFDAVTQFHLAAELPLGNMATKVDKKHIEWYEGRVKEEIGELASVVERMKSKYEKDGVPVLGVTYSIEDQADMLKEIVDAVYVLMGLALTFGLPFDAAFGLIHFANMMKVNDKAVKDEATGKIVKPEGWQPVDLLPLLFRTVEEDRANLKQQEAQAKAFEAAQKKAPANDGVFETPPQKQ